MPLVGTPDVVVTVSTIKIPFEGLLVESANGYDFGAILKVIALSSDVETARSGFSNETDSIADHIAVTLNKPATVEEATQFALRLKAIIEAIVDDDSFEDPGPNGEDERDVTT